jgi:hypothetical protein
VSAIARTGPSQATAFESAIEDVLPEIRRTSKRREGARDQAVMR